MPLEATVFMDVILGSFVFFVYPLVCVKVKAGPGNEKRNKRRFGSPLGAFRVLRVHAATDVPKAGRG
jgi:hypothetical protein